VFQGFSKGQSKGQQQISSTWHAANPLTLHGALEEPGHMHNFTHQPKHESTQMLLLPSGKRLHNELERSTMLSMGKSTN
jgi:hypothetical protein